MRPSVIAFLLFFTLGPSLLAQGVDPKAAKLHLDAGRSLLRLEDYRSAVVELELAMRLAPTQDTLIDLALAHDGAKNNTETVKAYERLLNEYGTSLDTATAARARDRIAALSTNGRPCAVDIDCPGEDVCEAGFCTKAAASAPATIAPPTPQPVVSPAEPVPAPATAPAPSAAALTKPQAPPPAPSRPRTPRRWPVAALELELLLGLHGWGTYQADESDGSVAESDTLESVVWPGLRTAIMLAPSHLFHLGPYFGWMTGGTLLRYGNSDQGEAAQSRYWTLGLGLELGGLIADRLWLGMGLDVGLASFNIDATEIDSSQLGLHLHPKLQGELLLLRHTKVKLGIMASFGAILMPVAKGSFAEPAFLEGETWNWDEVRWFHAQLAGSVGVVVGL